MKHHDPTQASVRCALRDVDAVDDAPALRINDDPGVPHDVVVRVNAACGNNSCPGCRRVIALDPLDESVDSLPTPRRIDKLGIALHASNEQLTPSTGVRFIPSSKVRLDNFIHASDSTPRSDVGPIIGQAPKRQGSRLRECPFRHSDNKGAR